MIRIVLCTCERPGYHAGIAPPSWLFVRTPVVGLYSPVRPQTENPPAVAGGVQESRFVTEAG